MEKSLSKAVSLKGKGNSEYKSRRLESSLKYYTKALFDAPCLSSVLEKTAEILKESCDDDHLKSFLALRNLPPTDKGITDNLIVAHCYGNRSAALIDLKKYKDALADIELAMYHGYPKEEFKMYKRKATCLSHLGKKSEALEVVEKYKEASKVVAPKDEVQKNIQTLMRDIRQIRSSSLCDDNDEVMGSFVSSSLYIDASPEKGRCVMAKKDIAFGKCVLSESPYVSFLCKQYLHTHCSHCFKKTLNIIPCCYCVSSGYCSMSCMQTAWKLYHWAECAIGTTYSNCDTELAVMTVRVLLTSLKDVRVLLKECQKSDLSSAIAKLTLEDSTDISDIYKSVLKLADTKNRSKVCQKVIDNIMVRYLDILTSYFETASLSSSTVIDPLKELLLLHMFQLDTNTILVSADTLPSNYQQGGGAEMSCVPTEKYGSALYLTAALFNHSCDHNTFRNFIVGNKINVLVYCSSLKKDEELCLSYGPKVGYMKKSQRKKELKSQRHFDCSCIACNDKPTKEMLRREYGWYGLSCPKCKGLLPKPDDTDILMSKCIDCGHLTDTDPLIKMESELKMRGRWLTSFGEIYESYQMLTKIVYKHNTLLRDCCKSLTSLCVQQGDYQSLMSAIRYSTQRCNIIEAIHGSYSSELACALPNHCRILSSRDIKASKQMARKALMLVELYYGVDDEDAKLLREFLKSR